MNDYIYERNTGLIYEGEEEHEHHHGEGMPILQASQADAIFKGYEAKLTFPLMENYWGLLDLTLFSDYTRGEFVGGGDVPRMPPLCYGLQLDYAYDSHWSPTCA